MIKNNRKNIDEFDRIWNEVVIPLLNKSVSTYNVKNKNLSICKIFCKKLFFKNKKNFIEKYMYWDTDKIDKHKIASCFMKSILLIKPIRIPFINKLKIRFKPLEYSNPIDKTLLINEYLSLSVAITIIEGYITTNYNENFCQHPLNHPIYFPDPFPDGDENYIKDICIDLHYTKAYKFNTITYANIFFLLEKYSCRKQRCFNLANDYRKILYQKYSLLFCNGKMPRESDLMNYEELLKIRSSIKSNPILSMNDSDLLDILVENKIYNAQLGISEDNLEDIDENKLFELKEIIKQQKKYNAK